MMEIPGPLKHGFSLFSLSHVNVLCASVLQRHPQGGALHLPKGLALKFASVVLYVPRVTLS